MNQRLSISLLLGVILAVSVLVAFALAGGSNGVALADDDVSLATLTVGRITLDRPVAMIGQEIHFTAVFTDQGITSYLANWDWDDDTTSPCFFDSGPEPVSDPETCTVEEIEKTGEWTVYRVTASHSYTEPLVYNVGLEVTREGSDPVPSEPEFVVVVVYDPEGGFVTGGGWIDSPPDAYTPDPSPTGKATFGFVSKYKKGANTPTGNTEFQFHAADLNFHSSSYEWLVVTGNNYAKFKGTGTINGEGEYKFKLWAGDDDPDTFRIKIWEEDEHGNETVTYDNGFDQAIAGGSIVIHTKRK